MGIQGDASAATSATSCALLGSKLTTMAAPTFGWPAVRPITR